MQTTEYKTLYKWRKNDFKEMSPNSAVTTYKCPGHFETLNINIDVNTIQTDIKIYYG